METTVLQESMNLICLPINHANRFYSTSSCCGASVAYKEEDEVIKKDICNDCKKSALFYCTICFGEMHIES